MSGEIKFRAWSRVSNAMFAIRKIQLEPDEFSDVGYVWLPPSQNPSDDGQVDLELVEVMQFTGLKDKNGKEIYEGDIVAVIPNNLYMGQVYYAEDKAGFALTNHNGDMGLMSLWDEYLEVIGNIYENKELLKETNK